MPHIKSLNKELWKELKAETRLERITIKDWLEGAIRKYLAKEHSLRQRLPPEAKCEMCGRTIFRDDRSPRIIAHHDRPNNRKASVVKLLCDQCHIERHRQLGWGTNYHPQKATRSHRFKCSLCKIWRSDNARAPVEVKAHTRLCIYCWTDRKEEAVEFIKPTRNWNERRGKR